MQRLPHSFAGLTALKHQRSVGSFQNLAIPSLLLSKLLQSCFDSHEFVKYVKLPWLVEERLQESREAQETLFPEDSCESWGVYVALDRPISKHWVRSDYETCETQKHFGLSHITFIQNKTTKCCDQQMTQSLADLQDFSGFSGFSWAQSHKTSPGFGIT